MNEQRYCPVCGNPISERNKRFCSHTCQGIGVRGSARPTMKGRRPWNKGVTAQKDERVAHNARSRLKNVIDKDMLYQLYVVENLTLKDVGLRYGVSKGVIKRLVDEYGLQRHVKKSDSLSVEVIRELTDQGLRFTEIADRFECSPAKVQKLAQSAGIHGKKEQNKANVTPNSETLKHLYWEEYLSYEAIGERLGVDFTTIPYWLKKFGIERRTAWQTRHGANWQPPSSETVEHLYEAENMGMAAIGDLFGVSRMYIKAVLEERGVVLRRPGYPNVSHYTSKDGHHVKSSLELQVDDWLYGHQIEHSYEPFVGDTKFRADFLVDTTYIEIWGITGNETYEQKRQRKLEAYQAQQLNLISIYPNDFPELHVLVPLAERFP